MKYESRADLLIAAGESMRMQEKAGGGSGAEIQGEVKFCLCCVFLRCS
jgi:hypothetical protein